MACKGCANLESEVEGLGRAPEHTHSEDEEQLHKDSSKWKDASNQRPGVCAWVRSELQ